jgi:hypothetical protein
MFHTTPEIVRKWEHFVVGPRPRNLKPKSLTPPISLTLNLAQSRAPPSLTLSRPPALSGDGRCPCLSSMRTGARLRAPALSLTGEHEDEHRPPSMTCAPAPPLHVPNLPPPRPTASRPSSRHLVAGRLRPVLLRPDAAVRSPPLRQRRFRPDPVCRPDSKHQHSPQSATPLVPPAG